MFQKREKEFLSKEQELNKLKYDLQNSKEQLAIKLENEKIMPEEMQKQKLIK